MSKVSIGSLSKEVIKELKTYAKVTTGKVKEAVKKTLVKQQKKKLT